MGEEKIRYISGKMLFPLIIEQLEQGKTVRMTVSGRSMMPWIVDNRDEVELVSACADNLKKGDIILFQPCDDKYVLHRIVKESPGGYITAGDGNLYLDGMVAYNRVIAKAVRIWRKGKSIDCDAGSWKLVFRIWMLLYPVRKYLLKLLYLWGRVKRIIICSGKTGIIG